MYGRKVSVNLPAFGFGLRGYFLHLTSLIGLSAIFSLMNAMYIPHLTGMYAERDRDRQSSKLLSLAVA